MLRAENCICGTTTTGTGTLALSACPSPPGGTDLFQAFNAQSLGTATSIPISYTIIEYTGSTFLTATKQEKGVGSLTLGANLAASTLARTTVQQTATSMDSTATYNTSNPTAINISTAANTLVFIGASASDIVIGSPYFDTTLPSSNAYGAFPVNAGSTTTSGIVITQVDPHDMYFPFDWRVPMLVKRLRISASRSSGSALSGQKFYGRLYALGANARPTKLLYDFGTFVGASLSTLPTVIATSATGSGFYMHSGEYVLNLFSTWSGVNVIYTSFTNPYNTGRFGWGSGVGQPLVLSATGGGTAAGDPANVTGLDMFSPNQLFFTLNTT